MAGPLVHASRSTRFPHPRRGAPLALGLLLLLLVPAAGRGQEPGVGVGGDARGIVIGGVGMGVGGTMEGLAVGGIGVGAPRLRGVAIGGVGVGLVIAPAYFKVEELGTFRGVSVSAFNDIRGEQRGLAIGLLNIADELHGVQIGLINIARNKESLGVLPFFNYHP